MAPREMGAEGGGEGVRAALDMLRRIVRALRLSARAAEKQVGISGAQLFVLQQLVDEGGLSVGELAARTHTHQSSVSVVVARLAERGLVRRRAGREDGRRSEVSLTPAGRALLRRAPNPAQERLVAGLAGLEPSDRRALVGALTRVVRAMGVAGERPQLFFEDEGAPRAKRQRRGKGHGGS